MNNKIKINMPKEVEFLIEELQDAGYDSYIVGGCVRDALLDREPHDWDLCTSATPEEMLQVFKKKNYIDVGNLEEYKINNILTIGEKYGTLTFIVNNESYEITTFRKETGYADGRHPDKIEYAKTVEEDLARRDFSINAMAYNHKEGLIDPYNGMQDLLKDKILRCVGIPEDRFKEDALRIMRALRFLAKYDLSPEKNTYLAMTSCQKKLNNISKERVSSELCKLLVENCTRVLLTFLDVVSTIIPEMAPCFNFKQKNPYHQYDVYIHILKTIENCPSKDIITRLALFFHDIGKPRCTEVDRHDPNRLHFYGHGEISAEMADEIMRRMKFDNETRKAVVELVYYHDSPFEVTEKHIRRWLNKIGPKQFERLMDIRESDVKGQRKEFYEARLQKVNDVRSLYKEMMEKEQCFSLKDLAVSGNDLIKIGYQQGKELGTALNELLELVINGEIENDEQALLERANIWLSNYMEENDYDY